MDIQRQVDARFGPVRECFAEVIGGQPPAKSVPLDVDKPRAWNREETPG